MEHSIPKGVWVAFLVAAWLVIPYASAEDSPDKPAPQPRIIGVKPIPVEPGTDSGKATAEDRNDAGKVPEVLSDISLLPAPVARLRAQILEAAHSGNIEKLRPILDGNDSPPIVSFGDASVDPIEFWKAASGDGDGRELLAILIEVLEADFVHVEPGTPNELFVWPYFAQYPLNQLTPAQEVELYKLVTAQDKQDMDQFGAYNFYRAGISPDGRWRYFVAGD